MWEIRIDEQTYRSQTNAPFRKERKDNTLMGNIRTLNEAKKTLEELYLAEDAKESDIFHADSIIRKKWSDSRKQEYMVNVEYVSPDVMAGHSERIYIIFCKG